MRSQVSVAPLLDLVRPHHRDVVLGVAGHHAGAAPDAARQVDDHRPAGVALDVLAVAASPAAGTPPGRCSSRRGAKPPLPRERPDALLAPGDHPGAVRVGLRQLGEGHRLRERAVVLDPDALLEEPVGELVEDGRVPVGARASCGRGRAGRTARRRRWSGPSPRPAGRWGSPRSPSLKRPNALCPSPIWIATVSRTDARVDVREGCAASRTARRTSTTSPCSTPISRAASGWISTHDSQDTLVTGSGSSSSQGRFAGAPVEEAVRGVDDQVEVGVRRSPRTGSARRPRGPAAAAGAGAAASRDAGACTGAAGPAAASTEPAAAAPRRGRCRRSAGASGGRGRGACAGNDAAALHRRPPGVRAAGEAGAQVVVVGVRGRHPGRGAAQLARHRKDARRPPAWC